MHDNKLTDNEIIKALECHIKGRCHSCPNGKEEIQLLHKPCSRTIAEYALSLINRQKAEISELQHRNFELEIELKAMRGAANSYKAENARLEDLNKCYYTSCQQIAKSNHEIKAEAIKEFAERLKSTNLYEFIEEYYENAELCYEVRQDQFEEYCDNLVKEMVGDDK